MDQLSAQQKRLLLIGGTALIGGALVYGVYRYMSNDHDEEGLFDGPNAAMNGKIAGDRSAVVTSSGVTQEKREAAVETVRALIVRFGGQLPSDPPSEDDKSTSSYKTDVELEYNIANEMESMLRQQILEVAMELQAENEEENAQEKGKGKKKKQKKRLPEADPKLQLLELAYEYLDTAGVRKKLKERLEQQRVLSPKKNSVVSHVPDDTLHRHAHDVVTRQRTNNYGDYFEDDDDAPQWGNNENDDDEYDDDEYDNDDDEEWEEDDEDMEFADEEEAENYRQFVLMNGGNPDDVVQYDDAMEEFIRDSFETELLAHIDELRVKKDEQDKALVNKVVELSGEPLETTPIDDDDYVTEDEEHDEVQKSSGKKKSGNKKKARKAAKGAGGEWIDL